MRSSRNVRDAAPVKEPAAAFPPRCPSRSPTTGSG